MKKGHTKSSVKSGGMIWRDFRGLHISVSQPGGVIGFAVCVTLINDAMFSFFVLLGCSLDLNQLHNSCCQCWRSRKPFNLIRD